MTKHVKPTSEELENKDKEIQEELEELENQEENLEEEVVEEEIVEEEEEEVVEEEEEVVEEEEKPEVKEQTYKKKFTESTKEAQVLHAKNKKMLDAFNQVSEVKDPTDEEMREELVDWEDLTEFEQKMAKDARKTSQRFEAINTIAQDNKDGSAWGVKVDKFVDDPATVTNNSDLEGRLDEFKLFAGKPSRRGVDFQDLISAFLYELQETKPAKKKGKMFETGSGGPNKKSKPKSGKMSIEAGAALKKSNYKAYVVALKADKIEKEF